MKKLKYNWEHGENKYQEYYDVYVGKEYLCVYMNKWTPGTWIGAWNDIVIHNKTRNDRIRKKYSLPKDCSFYDLPRDTLLTSADPQYTMRKVEWCYAHKLSEISE